MLENILQADTSALIWARGLIGPEHALMIQIAWESIVLFVAFFLLFLWFTGVMRQDNRYRVWALEIFFIVILTFILHAIINFWVPQWRMWPQDVVGGVAPLIPHPIDNSFPSGHALFTAAFVVGLSHAYRKWWAILIAIILWLITAAARIIGGVHYPGDILGGWLFGTLGGLASIYAISTSLFRLSIFPTIIRIMSFLKL